MSEMNYFASCGNYADRLQAIYKKRIGIKTKNKENETPINELDEVEKVLDFYKKIVAVADKMNNSGKIISEAIAQFEDNIEDGQTFEESANDVLENFSQNQKNDIEKVDDNLESDGIDISDILEEDEKDEKSKESVSDKMKKIFTEEDKRKVESRMKNRDEEDTLQDTIYKKVLSDAYHYMDTMEESDSNYSKAETLKHIMNLLVQEDETYEKVALEVAQTFNLREVIKSDENEQNLADTNTILEIFNREAGTNLSLEDYKRMLLNDKHMKTHHWLKTYNKYQTVEEIIERAKERTKIDKIREAVDIAVRENNNEALINCALNYPDQMRFVLEDYFVKNNQEVSDSSTIQKIMLIDQALRDAREIQENEGIDLDDQQDERASLVLKTIKRNVEKAEKNENKIGFERGILSRIIKLQYEENKECSEYALELAKKYHMDELIEADENGERVVGIEKALDISNKRNHTNISLDEYSEARENAVGKVIFFRKMNQLQEKGSSQEEIIEEMRSDPDKAEEYVKAQVAKASKSGNSIDFEAAQTLAGILKTVKEENKKNKNVDKISTGAKKASSVIRGQGEELEL